MVALGFAPLLVWEAFSLCYYGAFLPNTYYAKLATGVSPFANVSRGWAYFVGSAVADPLLVLLIPLGLLATLARRAFHLLPASVAIVLWLVYLLRIGGDFMVGRFFTPVIVLSAMIFARFPRPRRQLLAGLAAVVLACGFLAPLSPWRCGRDYDIDSLKDRLRGAHLLRGNSDERAYYGPYTGLLSSRRAGEAIAHPWAVQGRQARLQSESSDAPRSPIITGAIGMLGFYTGPAVHIIDTCALADPLLARLPPLDAANARTGHYRRALPAGYVETIEMRENRLEDPDLAAYYERLALLVRGEIWSRARFRAILELNSGRLERLLKAYLARVTSD